MTVGGTNTSTATTNSDTYMPGQHHQHTDCQETTNTTERSSSRTMAMIVGRV
jgi:hypothetical protein